MIAEILVICSLTLIGYNYLVYPSLMILRAAMLPDDKPTDRAADEVLPRVSFVIAAYNEEKVIADKLDNTLELDYPAELLQIIVVSDGSDDATPGIVDNYAKDNVLNLHQPERRGKSAALNRSLAHVSGDIIVFSDANNDFNQRSVRELVKHFGDSRVGGVTGAKRIYQNEERESARGDSLYWKYESKIKKAESILGSITAAEGEIFAVRASLIDSIDPHKINDDAAITFDLVKRGYRVLYEERAVSMEQASNELTDDFRVKVRMTAGGFQTIVNEFSFLIPPRNWFAFTFFSHKILRWVTPWLMLLLLVANLFLLDDFYFRALFVSQLMFYGLAICGWLKRHSPDLPTLLYVPMYFCYMNLALLVGFLSFVRGIQGVNWSKASR